LGIKWTVAVDEGDDKPETDRPAHLDGFQCLKAMPELRLAGCESGLLRSATAPAAQRTCPERPNASIRIFSY
jgi:hypothetical protein